jgi:hypothetical protein
MSRSPHLRDTTALQAHLMWIEKYEFLNAGRVVHDNGTIVMEYTGDNVGNELAEWLAYGTIAEQRVRSPMGTLCWMPIAFGYPRWADDRSQ